MHFQILPAHFHAVISSDASRQRICRVRLSQHLPCSLDHVQTLPHLNPHRNVHDHSMQNNITVQDSVGRTKSPPNVWKYCHVCSRRVSPSLRLVQSSWSWPVPCRKAYSSGPSSVPSGDPQTPDTRTERLRIWTMMTLLIKYEPQMRRKGRRPKDLHEFEGHQFEASPLEAPHDFSHHLPLYAIWFYSDEGALVHAGPA